MKLSQKSMHAFLETKLVPGETLLCSVYTGLKFGSALGYSSQVIPACAACTSLGRLFICTSLSGTFGSFALLKAQKLKLGKNLFGQHVVEAVFADGKDTIRFKLQIAPKVYASGFPDQPEHLETMLSILRKYAVG